ncbi:hypothetical protein L596_002834 [Steinernema carpocapsae]|uniref:Glycosyl hydrolase family 31 C-terminal domain-containing protein n=1 Tax=Steinernema carpocapsae TaxID=34508 RepID=A0A4U8UTB7_STECR|nr:hypothetical protein L596_002834 [Steinernema carpocapsae]
MRNPNTAKNANERVQYNRLRKHRARSKTRKHFSPGSRAGSACHPSLFYSLVEVNTRRLQIGVAGFKFDAGEVSYLPEDFVLKNGSTPNDFTKAYIEFAAQNFASEARVGFKTQEQAIFIRTMDRLSTWNNCGIQTVLPILFNYAVCGYNFNLPDMIGGNSYDGKLCNKQLFVRWVQLNTFLMSMQFSIAPWDFDQETIRVCQKMMAVRKEHIIYLIEQFKSSTQGNLPIRPLWWAIESEEAVECSDQFLVGDNLLVAPVLQEDQWSRTVLLPEGSWRDHDGIEHTGGKKIIVQSPLDVLEILILQLFSSSSSNQ